MLDMRPHDDALVGIPGAVFRSARYVSIEAEANSLTETGGELMEFTVEFYGLPRRLSGVKETAVDVEHGASLRDVVAALAKRFPAFLNELIDPQTYDLEEPYFFNIDARFVPPSLDHVPQQGQRLLLLFLEAGG
jgi:hypothetical protein